MVVDLEPELEVQAAQMWLNASVDHSPMFSVARQVRLKNLFFYLCVVRTLSYYKIRLLRYVLSRSHLMISTLYLADEGKPQKVFLVTRPLRGGGLKAWPLRKNNLF